AQQMPPPARASYWESWSQKHPGSVLASAVQREVEVLRAPPPAPAQPAQTAAAPAPEPPAPPPELAAPMHALAGDPLELVLTFARNAPKAAQLNYRPRGSTLYRTVSFDADDSRYWRVRLPAEAAQPPGLDYYVGLIDGDGSE